MIRAATVALVVLALAPPPFGTGRVGRLLGQEPSGRVLEAMPGVVDPGARYLIYLHGQIVEEQGREAVSPAFGRYEYDAIVSALSAGGNTVIGEIRPRGTDVRAFAERVAGDVRRLISAGIPARRITIVGASKGAQIALRTSTLLETPGIGYVVIAGCNQAVQDALELDLHGDVLSIYESSDTVAGSCAPIFAVSPDLGARGEKRLETGLKHGFLYRPLTDWVGPALAWVSERR